MRLICFGDHSVQDQDLCTVRHVLTDVAKYCLTFILIPIMNYMFEHIDVGLDRYLFEEIALDDLDTVLHVIPLKHIRRTFKDRGHIEQNALHVRVCRSDGSDEMAMTAADVGYGTGARE